MININGKNISEEEFLKMQEQFEKQRSLQYNQWEQMVKCAYASVRDIGIAICGLNRKQIDPRVDCIKCKAFAESNYEIIDN